MAGKGVEQRVRRIAEAALGEQRFVSALDVLLGLGWLTPSHVHRWRQGRLESLESALQVNPNKVTAAMAVLRRWAQERGCSPPRPITLPAPATGASCGSASTGIPTSKLPTAHTGFRPAYRSAQSSGKAVHRISSSSGRSKNGRAHRVAAPETS
ncbi:hypothetical protein I552_6931 [Mycobacterium xenopi 3993]|nr:hypothetical protein I552_6931 [Mycobacterium xenopi 3993]